MADRGLTAPAVGALIPLMGSVGFEELGLVKALLKRFFSTGPWTAMDAAALADAVGPPASSVEGDVEIIRHRLDEDLELVAGWVDGRFVLDVEVGEEVAPSAVAASSPTDLGSTFASTIVPQPTPNPRTIRFATGRRAGAPAPSSSFRRGEPVDDPRVSAILAVDGDVVDVLVAAEFVAVSLARPARWPELLAPVLDAVAAGFEGDVLIETDDADDPTVPDAPDVRGVAVARPGPTEEARRRTRLDRAWADLGHLDATRAADLETLVAATTDPEAVRRQVAAQLLDRAPEDEAARAWAALVDDPSRAVRRAVVDVVAGAGRPSLRRLLERATADADAWVRWKALHGLVELGIEPSRAVVARLADDPDFRVRLEAENATRP